MEERSYRTREGIEVFYYIYSEEEIEKANSANIADLAREKGYNFKDMNQRWAEIKGQGGLSIDKAGNRWYCHSTGKGGGPIQLLMYLEGLKWQDAVKELIDGEVSYQRYIPVMEVKELNKNDFVLPEANTTYRHVFAYLINTRKIDSKIVQKFVDDKLIYENKMKSCVFVGRDKEGKARFANIRSTNTYGSSFKGNAELSDKRFGFAKVGSNNILTIMEAPIDLMSYMTIFKKNNALHLIENDHLFALGGLSNIALKQYLEDHPQITEIRIGLDNDKYGKKKCVSLYGDYYEKYKIKRINFRNKDLNDILTKTGTDSIMDEKDIIKNINSFPQKSLIDENSLFKLVKAQGEEISLMKGIIEVLGINSLLDYAASSGVCDKTQKALEGLNNILNCKEGYINNIVELTGVPLKKISQLPVENRNIKYLIQHSSEVGLNLEQSLSLKCLYNVAVTYNMDLKKIEVNHERFAFIQKALYETQAAYQNHQADQDCEMEV